MALDKIKNHHKYFLILVFALLSASLGILVPNVFADQPLPNGTSVIFQDNYSSSSGWTQIGTEVTVNSAQFPGVAYFNNTVGGGGVTEERMVKQIPSTLPSRWTADFDYKFTASSIPAHLIFALTNTSVDPQSQPVSNRALVEHGIGANQLFVVGPLDTVSPSIPISQNIQYYVRLDKTPTQLTLYVFSDASRTVQVPGSPAILAISPTDYNNNLNYIQHDGCRDCGSARTLTAHIDNTRIYSTPVLPTVPSAPGYSTVFSDDYSTNAGWTQIGTEVSVSNGRAVINGIDGSDHHIYKSLGTTLSNTTALRLDFDFIFTAANNPAHYVAALTSNANNPDLTGSMIAAELGNNGNTLVIGYKAASSTQVSISRIPLSVNTQYYVTLERLNSTMLKLSAFYDSAGSVQVAGSPIYQTIPSRLTGLTTMEHAIAQKGCTCRSMTGYVDNTQVTAGSLVATAVYPSQVNLSWTAPSSNGSSAITSYKVYRGTASNAETLLATIGNTTGYSDGAVTSGQTYYYKVTAVNQIGESAPSNEASATFATVSSAPTGLTATAISPSQVSLSWTAPSSNGGSAITSYKVYRGTASNAETLLATIGNVPAYNDTQVTSGQTYYYKVTAVNPIGESAPSNEASVKVVTVPSAPGYSTVFSDDYSTNAGWTQIGTEVSVSNGRAVINGIDGSDHHIYKSLGTTLSNTTALRLDFDFIFTAANNPAHYVAALTSNANNPDLTGSMLGAGLGINGNTLAITYKAPSGSSQFSTSLIPLSAGTQYYVTVERLSPTLAKLSAFYNPARTVQVAGSPTYQTIPNGVTGLSIIEHAVSQYGCTCRSMTGYVDNTQVTAGSLVATIVSPSQINLSWTAPANNGGSPVTNYKIYRSTSSGTETLLNTIGNATSYTDSTVTSGQTYYYKVTAVNQIGESAPSNEASATFATVSSAPTGLTATAVSSSQINLSWTAPANDVGSSITGYKIERESPIGGGFSTISITNNAIPAYNDMGLAPNTQYNYRVSAINSVGTSVPSNTASATTTGTITTNGIVLNNVQSTSGTVSPSNQIILSSFNASAGNNRLLVVGVSANNNNVVSITFGGVPLANAVSSFYNNDAELWYLKNPSGTEGITVTMRGPTQAVVGAYSFSGVNQTLPIPTSATDHNTTPGSPAISITTKYANDLVLDLPSIYGGSTLGSPTCAQQWDANVPNAITGASSLYTTQSPVAVTCKWAASSADLWDDVAVELNAAR